MAIIRHFQMKEICNEIKFNECEDSCKHLAYTILFNLQLQVRWYTNVNNLQIFKCNVTYRIIAQQLVTQARHRQCIIYSSLELH
jgi:hypothetical protein